jgi:hypothetical protein
MPGALINLVSIGAMDKRISKSPEISYWKTFYKRSTNFAKESIKQSFDGTVAAGNTVSRIISRDGELLSDMFLEIYPPNTGSTDSSQADVWQTNRAYKFGDVVKGTVTVNTGIGVNQVLNTIETTGTKLNGDKFGGATALSRNGQYLAVGCINGTNSSGNTTGTVQVFKRGNELWETHGTIISPYDTADTKQEFGHSLGISDDGNTIIVGMNTKPNLLPTYTELYSAPGIPWAGHDQIYTDLIINFYDIWASSDYENNLHNNWVTFDAGVGNTWSIKFNSWLIEHSSGNMYDRLGMLVSNDGITWVNASVPWWHQSQISVIPTEDTGVGAVPWGMTYDTGNQTTSVNGWILPGTPAIATSLGWDGSDLAVNSRFMKFHWHSDHSVVYSGWDLTLTSTGANKVAGGVEVYTYNKTANTYALKHGTVSRFSTNLFESMNAVAINGLGDVIAIGKSTETDTISLNRGSVVIKKWNDTTKVWDDWTSFFGFNANEYFGTSVALNQAGTRLAVGVPGKSVTWSSTATTQVSGAVRIYENTSNDVNVNWSLLGQELTLEDGVGSADHTDYLDAKLGYSVALNNAGDIVIAGAPYSNSGHGASQVNGGEMRVWTFTNPTWVARNPGEELLAAYENTHLGSYVNINGSGDTILFAGANSTNTTYPAQESLFLHRWDGVSQYGGSIDWYLQTRAGNTPGALVPSMDDSGFIVALGYPGYDGSDGFATDTGHVRVFNPTKNATIAYKCVQAGTSGTLEPTWKGGLDGTLSTAYDIPSIILDGVGDGVIRWEATQEVFYPSIGGDDIYGLVDYVAIEIGGQVMAKFTGEWIKLWYKLTTPYGKIAGLKALTDVPPSRTGASSVVSMPLPFWFCRDNGLSLPLVALPYHEVRIVLKFSNNLIAGSYANLYADYVFLDTEERKRFATSDHEYLIEQVQETTEDIGTHTFVPIYFNHPVKEIIWKLDDANHDKLEHATLLLAGQERFSRRDADYFSKVQRYQHHSTSQEAGDKEVYMYSFALNPEKTQPSGSCNFSRMNNSSLILEGSAIGAGASVTVYGLNYNVIRISNGLCVLAYSN